MARRALPLLPALALLLAPGAPAQAPESTARFWQDASPEALAGAPSPRVLPAGRYRDLALDLDGLRAYLKGAPLENTGEPLVLELPRPDGGFARFAVVESPIMEAPLQAKFPEIRTYRGQGLDQREATVRFDVTPQGFHAQVLAPTGRIFVDPFRAGETRFYQAYFTRDVAGAGREPFRCDFRPEAEALAAPPQPNTPTGPTLRTYRLALAATGEYSTRVCLPNPVGVPCAMAAIVTSMNRVDGIYETEVAIRMVLVANNDQVVFTDGTTDPYTNNSGSMMLNQNQATLDAPAPIGSANYDIGHVFSTGGGGIASLGVPCRAGNKARGVTGLTNPIGDNFDVDYVAHEMGHQWGANHSFNGTTTNCGGGNRSAAHAYEPGSGSSIMAYAGICGIENLQPHSDPYFHTDSFDAIVTYSNTGLGNGCAVATATGNNSPVPNAGAAFTIPRQTPFALTGSATDPDGDALTYDWQEFDLGTAAPPNDDVAAVRPILREFNPTVSPTRTFPKLADILSNTPTFGESLPTRTRAMVFRLIARDNRSGGGGVDRTSTTVNVNAGAGPFAITAPNTNVTWNIGENATVTWAVAGTDVAPVSCANVKLSLSIDSGQSFPMVLLASTANDGSEDVVVPAVAPGTSTARVKVECVGNIFFDINDQNFTIDIVPVELQSFRVE